MTTFVYYDDALMNDGGDILAAFDDAGNVEEGVDRSNVFELPLSEKIEHSDVPSGETQNKNDLRASSRCGRSCHSGDAPSRTHFQPTG